MIFSDNFNYQKLISKFPLFVLFLEVKLHCRYFYSALDESNLNIQKFRQSEVLLIYLAHTQQGKNRLGQVVRQSEVLLRYLAHTQQGKHRLGQVVRLSEVLLRYLAHTQQGKHQLGTLEKRSFCPKVLWFRRSFGKGPLAKRSFWLKVLLYQICLHLPP